MAAEFKERTVAFYEVVRLEDNEHLAESDWQGFLTEIINLPPITAVYNGNQVAGKVHTINNAYHLVLSKPRDDVPQQRHRKTGDEKSVAVDGDDWDVVDQTFVVFFPYGNLLGVLQATNVASPSAVALAHWINHTQKLSDRIALNSIVEHDMWQRFKNMPVASVELMARTDQVANIEDGPVSYLAGLSKFGDVKIELKITAGVAAKRISEQGKLRELVTDIQTRIGFDKLDKLKAKPSSSADGLLREPIDLIAHRLTMTKEVPIQGEPGNRSITATAAIEAIAAAETALRSRLRVALSLPAEAP